MFEKLILFDLKHEMCNAWGIEFEGFDKLPVVIHEGPLEGMIAVQDPDMISSAANSFGIMGAGIDGALRTYFPGCQDLVQHAIAMSPHCGEVAIGSSILVRAVGEDEQARMIAYTPTMRYPGTQTDGENVYRAARAAIVQGALHGARRLALPGMGTGIGRVDPRVCAKAQRAALESVLSWASSKKGRVTIEARQQADRLWE